MGTVYRNLNFLSDAGLIRKVLVPNASDRFDGTVVEHHHMLCTQCGEVFDLAHDLAEEFSQEILLKTGFEINHCGLMVLGKCVSCREKECRPASTVKQPIE